MVLCPSSVVNYFFSSQTAGPILTKLGRNVPWEVLFKNLFTEFDSIKNCGCQATKWNFFKQLFKIVSSGTTGPIFSSMVEGQQAIVMVLCLWCVRPSVHLSVRKLFLQKASPGFLPKFTRMFLRWSSFKFLQIIVFHEEFWSLWQPK